MNKWFSSSWLFLLHLLEPLGAASTSNWERHGRSSPSVRFCRNSTLRVRADWILSTHARTHIHCGAGCNKGFKVQQEKKDRLDLSRVCAWCGRGATALRRSTWYRIQTGANKGERENNQRIRLVCCLGRKKMSKPDYSGTYHLVEQTNMDAYLGGLGEAVACFNFFLKQL